MRQGTNNRRSRGRGGGRKQPGGGRFQSFDSNGPGGRLRGNALQLYEKYQTLGRDASSSDRIIAENLLQHAEHYFRVMNAAAAAASNDEGQARSRPNGGDDQPTGEAVGQPAAELESETQPAPEEEGGEAAPAKRPAGRPRKRRGNGKADAEASEATAAPHDESDQELAS